MTHTIAQPTTEKDTPNQTGSTPFAQLLDQYDILKPERGQILTGEILRFDDDVLYVDVGAKRDAIVPYYEIDRLAENFLDALALGDEIPVYVTRTPIGDEELIVSLERGLEQQDWERAEELKNKEETVRVEIVGHNKGGLLVAFGRLQGFVPNSHEPELRRLHDHSERSAYKSSQVGELLPAKVIEIDPDRQRLVLSATAAQKELKREQLQDLEEGQKVEGQVVHLTDYGAFVDLGYVTGLLHISKMSWDHVEDPAEELSVGDELELLIDNIDLERGRISLNRRALLPSPWEQFTEDYEEGDLVEGVVTAVLDFGAFALVDHGIEGLIHVSELSDGWNENPENVLQPGDTVLARIISMEPDRDRLGLSLRQVSQDEQVQWMMEQQQAAVSPEAVEDIEVIAEPAAVEDTDADVVNDEIVDDELVDDEIVLADGVAAEA